MKKKLLSVLLTMVLLMSLLIVGMFTLPVSADFLPITVSYNDTAVLGETVTLTFKTGNISGLQDWEIFLYYDDAVLELVEQKDGAFSSVVFESPFSGHASACWHSDQIDYTSGVLCSFLFKAKETASPGVTHIEYDTFGFGSELEGVTTRLYINIEKPCVHEYDYRCDTTCNVCGATRTTTHVYDNACDTTCNVCGEARKITHTYKTVTQKATLTADGYTVKRCSECDEETEKKTLYKVSSITLSKTSFTDNGKVQKPTVIVKDANGAELTEGTSYTVTYDSGCKEVGTYKVTVKLKGNYYGSKTLTFTITCSHKYKAATCTAPKTCSVCGDTEGEALGHDYKAATCTAPKTCSVCGDTEGEALGHDYIAATCTAPKTCTTCGITSGSALRHTYSNACDSTCNRSGCSYTRTVGAHVYNNVCDTTCNVCGATRTIQHTYAAATCTTPKTCKTCGKTSGSALGHKFSNACDRSCNRCKEERVVNPHVYSDDYCDEDCDICGAVRKDCHYYRDACDIDCNLCGKVRKVTHYFNNDCDEYCNVCGEYREVPGHKYTNKCDRDCNECGYCRTITHKYSNKCDSTCNYCGSQRKVAAHSYKTAVGKAATMTANGYKIKTCTECKKTTGNKITINKVGHIKLSKTSYTYNGKVQKPTVTVKDSMGNTISSSNYTITYASGCKSAGTYKVTIKMKGNYTGTVTKTFKIAPQDVSKCKITLSATSYTYNGAVKKPTVTVKNAAGTKLTLNGSYTVTYASGRKNVGTYKVTVKMKGNYTGTKSITFKILPAKTSISSLIAGTKKLTVKWAKKTTQVTGYQIQYSTSKTFASSVKTKTITKNSTVSTSLTSLSAKKTYYVRIRTYKTVNGVKIYSGWSTVKSLKTK